MIVYHGTTGDFVKFDLSKSGTENDYGYAGKGFYFINNAEWASAYAEQSKRSGANVLPVYLRMINPFIIDEYEELPGHPGGSKIPNKNETETIQLELKRKGFDGIIVRGNPSEFVVFSSDQIKSAIGNQGTFDPNDPDITKD